MKKIISLLLALTLAFSILSLVSCKGGEDGNTTETAKTLGGKTPKELYDVLKANLSNATDYSITSNQIISADGFEMNQTIIMKLDGDNGYVEIIDESDSGANVLVWYVDGMLYANYSGQKVKCAYDKEKYMETYMGSNPSESTLLDIPDSFFSDTEFEKEGECWVVKFVLVADKYNQLLDLFNVEGTVVGNVTYKLHFNTDGSINKLTTAFDMNVDGVMAHCDEVSYIALDNVTITAPQDADSYQLKVAS